VHTYPSGTLTPNNLGGEAGFNYGAANGWYDWGTGSLRMEVWDPANFWWFNRLNGCYNNIHPYIKLDIQIPLGTKASFFVEGTADCVNRNAGAYYDIISGTDSRQTIYIKTSFFSAIPNNRWYAIGLVAFDTPCIIYVYSISFSDYACTTGFTCNEVSTTIHAMNYPGITTNALGFLSDIYKYQADSGVSKRYANPGIGVTATYPRDEWYSHIKCVLNFNNFIYIKVRVIKFGDSGCMGRNVTR
jgi:hypothetical protein